jgi:peroxiredoxin
MIRLCIAVVAFGASALVAQTPAELLQRIADRFNHADTFHVRGTASAPVPGTSWRARYEFESEGAQPGFLPLSARQASMQVISTASHFSQELAVRGARDAQPTRSFMMAPFGRYNELTMRLVDAQKIDSERLTMHGHAYACDVIDVTYDFSPDYKPHSNLVHRRLWVAGSDLLVLREIGSSADGMEWTADVKSVTFDEPASPNMMKALDAFAAQAKDRSDWVGRAVPDLAVPQLSGGTVRLAEFWGRPVLLDFWGSYCETCKRTTQHAQELQQRYQSSGLEVLTLTRDTAEDARLWTDYNHVTLPVLLDAEGTAFNAFEVQGVPVAILIGRDGKVMHYWVGLDHPEEMDAVVGAGVQAGSVQENGEAQPR